MIDPALKQMSMPSRSMTLARVAMLAAVVLAGCGQQSRPAPAGPSYTGTAPAGVSHPYRLAVHPLHNPLKLQQAYQPLIDRLELELPGTHFQLEASRDYAAFERKLAQRGPEFVLPNPWQTLQAMKAGYTVIAMAGDAQDFRGLILVRRDSAVHQPADLIGQAVSYPSPTALAACIMPQYFLHQRGIDIARDIENRYVGSQESSILSAYRKQAAAAATWPPPWRAFQKDHPQEAAELKVMWETPPLLNNSVMVRDDVPPELRSEVRRVLLALDRSAAGRAVLESMQTARFHPADDGRYEEVRRYVAAFEREVRVVETRP